MNSSHYYKIIKTNSDLLLRLINDILDLSRLEANRVTLTWEECDVVQLCSQVVASVSFSRQSSDNQFLFSTSFETFRMVTDVQRMQQVIINLLSNADKFTKRGKITLDFSVNEEKQMAIFSVTDTGCGEIGLHGVGQAVHPLLFGAPVDIQVVLLGGGER